MITDSEALDRIERSTRHYLSRSITRGEILEEITDALEANGRFCVAESMRSVDDEARRSGRSPQGRR